MQISIYELDHALLKTPIPNPFLYTADTLALLGDRAQGHVAWHRSASILTKADEWNETLLEMVRRDMEDPDCIPVLYCNRYNEVSTLTAVSKLVNSQSLKFEIIRITGAVKGLTNFVDELLDAYPTCGELSLYAAPYIDGRDGDLEDVIHTKYPEVNYFRVQCPFQSCFLDPTLELKLVKKLVRTYIGKNIENSYVTTCMLDDGVILQFGVTQRQQLFAAAYETGFRPEQLKQMIFGGDFIHVCRRPKAEKVLKFYLGKEGTEAEVEAKEYGFVEGRLYAIRFSPVIHNLDYVYGEYPIAFLAYQKGHDFATQAALVGQIANWKPLKMSEEGLILRTRVSSYKRLEVKQMQQNK